MISSPADMFERALAVMQYAYAPYSNYRVGCSLLTTDGRIFTGCNVENSAYPLSQCAEASAVGSMIAGGATAIAAVLVVADHAKPCVPCGGCRQRLSEFASLNTPVYFADKQGVVSMHTLSELLPFNFGPDYLEATELDKS